MLFRDSTGGNGERQTMRRASIAVNAVFLTRRELQVARSVESEEFDY
jgi:hypothetical protein